MYFQILHKHILQNFIFPIKKLSLHNKSVFNDRLNSKGE